MHRSVFLGTAVVVALWSCSPIPNPDPAGRGPGQPDSTAEDTDRPAGNQTSAVAEDAGLPVIGGDGLDGGVASADGCADLFAQDQLPTYDVEISPAEWSKLQDEFLHLTERLAAGLEKHPFHPIVFRYQNEVVNDAMIRLKGQSSWELAIKNDPDPKMQFEISFNEVNPKGRFHGLRKIVLDMPRNDRTYLRQRLALWFLRKNGVPAQCANNARLEINGTYYGLYTNLEHLDKEFLQRVYPAEDEGDLWKSGDQLDTNEDTSDGAHRDAFFSVSTAQQVAKMSDLNGALLEWATEAVMPDIDGYYAGTQNFYLYDHPRRGFVWLPYDLDGTFDFESPEIDPLTWRFTPKRLHWQLVMADAMWRQKYVDALATVLGRYDPQTLSSLVTTWTAQIAQAAADEPHRPFTLAEHDDAVASMQYSFSARHDYVARWIDCQRGGGEDLDHDGFDWCNECNDSDSSTHPGAHEYCGDHQDNNCDGDVDEGCPVDPPDAGVADAGTSDAGVTDPGESDAGVSDSPDAGITAPDGGI